MVVNGNINTLQKLIKKNILLLNNDLPDNFGSIWVTGEELHQRLLHAGVDISLTLEMVQDALRNSNRGEVFLKKWEYSGVDYFRSAVAHLKDVTNSPMEQRLKGKGGSPNRRININPIRDYFKSSNNSHFRLVNDALLKLEVALEEERERERSKSNNDELFNSIQLTSGQLTYFNIFVFQFRQAGRDKINGNSV